MIIQVFAFLFLVVGCSVGSFIISFGLTKSVLLVG